MRIHRASIVGVCAASLLLLSGCSASNNNESKPVATATVTATATATGSKADEAGAAKDKDAASSAKERGINDPADSAVCSDEDPVEAPGRGYGIAKPGAMITYPNGDERWEWPDPDLSKLSGPLLTVGQTHCIFRHGDTDEYVAKHGRKYKVDKRVWKNQNDLSDPTIDSERKSEINETEYQAGSKYDFHIDILEGNKRIGNGFTCSVVDPDDAAILVDFYDRYPKDGISFNNDFALYNSAVLTGAVKSQFKFGEYRVRHLHGSHGSMTPDENKQDAQTIDIVKGGMDDVDIIGNIVCFSSSKIEDEVTADVFNEFVRVSKLDR